MNLQAVQAGLQLLAVVESGVATLRSLFSQLATGQPMDDATLADLKARSDAAAATIAAWHAPANTAHNLADEPGL